MTKISILSYRNLNRLVKIIQTRLDRKYDNMQIKFLKLLTRFKI